MANGLLSFPELKRQCFFDTMISVQVVLLICSDTYVSNTRLNRALTFGYWFPKSSVLYSLTHNVERGRQAWTHPRPITRRKKTPNKSLPKKIKQSAHQVHQKKPRKQTPDERWSEHCSSCTPGHFCAWSRSIFLRVNMRKKKIKFRGGEKIKSSL